MRAVKPNGSGGCLQFHERWAAAIAQFLRSANSHAMRNRSSQVIVTLAVVCAGLLLIGCDYCRSGRYRLTLQPLSRHETTTRIRSTDEARLVELLQSALRERGFRQLRPEFWTRRGADVTWETNARGELTLYVGAFGAKRELRESEQVELELVRFLLSQPGVSVTPLESPGHPTSQ